VSWHDRDWARWTDEERRRFCAAPGGAPATPRRSLHPGGLWAVLATLVASVLGFAGYANRPWAAPSAPAAPAVVYGEQAVPIAGGPLPPASAGDPRAPGGSGTVCTDEIAEAGAWVCATYDVLAPGQSAASAAPAAVPCANERTADQSTGRWVCADSLPSVS